MNNLQIQDITTLFVVTDDCLPEKIKRAGRPSALADSEMITVILWCTLILRQKHLKTIHKFIRLYHLSEFPKLPNYANFVAHCHRLIPLICELIQYSLATDSELRFADSTMLQVCRIVRADSHRVAKGVADFGKNHQGWHYGFKLHASINPEGQFCGIRFTPASFHDAQALPDLVKGNTKIVVGDTLYGAKVMKEKLWKEQGIFILAPPHPKQKTKLMAEWQLFLLEARPKIESVFDYLKNHLGLVTSFARSVIGYLFHYLRIILAYQFELAFF
jgi:hypothetical protein